MVLSLYLVILIAAFKTNHIKTANKKALTIAPNYTGCMPLKANGIMGQLRVWVVSEEVGAPASNWILITESRNPKVIQALLPSQVSHKHLTCPARPEEPSTSRRASVCYFILWQVS